MKALDKIGEITTTVTDFSNRAHEASKLVAATRGHAESSGVIGVIDEIALQTNLLALNAGVEAGRAGEAGKGFAVVAQEVRELAQRSASAAKNIKELIATSASSVERGVSLVLRTGTALGEIVQQVQEVDGRVHAISVSSQEQTQGIKEISAAVAVVDQSTQRNASTVEEASAAAQELSNEAQRLRQFWKIQDICAGSLAWRWPVDCQSSLTQSPVWRRRRGAPDQRPLCRPLSPAVKH